ncbi:DUF3953 domain-containing protein [Halobacillus fulvus]|nr:DUF3953 domain-containing protein [Halobacillus fulvus]
MLRASRLVLSIVTVAISVYILLTRNFDILPYMLAALGASTLLIGISEVQKDRRNFWGYTSIVVSFLVFYVSIQSFIVFQH